MQKANTPEIIKASTEGDTVKVQSLLEIGVSTETRDLYGRTALMTASKHLKVLEILLNNGANINAVDSSGKTPLIFSVFASNIQATKFLLERGADAHTRDKSGRLPLTYAWEASNYEMLEVFYDAEPKFDIASAAVVGKLEGVKDILREGSNIDKRSEFGETALTASIGRDHFAVAKYLIQVGADVNLIGRYCSPLVSVILKRNVQLVKDLIHHGADINGLTDYGSPLIAAVTSGDLEIIELLLDNQADINAVDAEGDTVLSLAIYEENYEIVEFLKRKIATFDEQASKEGDIQ